MKVNLKESDAFQGFVTMISQHNMQCTMDQFEMISKGVLQGMARWLSLAKNTNTPVGITITDFKGNVVLIAYCKHIDAAEDQDETKGSWIIDYSFNPEDMPKGAKVTDIKEPAVFTAFDTASRSIGYFYANNSDLIAISIAFVRSVVDWLDVNAKVDDEVELEYDGVFSAKVVVENGEKIMGIVVSEEIKNIVKGNGDDLLSKDEVK